MAPSKKHLLTLAFLIISVTATNDGYGPPPPPLPSPPYSGPDPIYDPLSGGSGGSHGSGGSGGFGIFPPGFPFNVLPPNPGGNPNPGGPVRPPPSPTYPVLPPVSTKTAGGLFTTLPGGPGGPIDPNCPKTIVSVTVLTHISTTVISYTNTISSLETLTNSLCAPITIPTLPPAVFTSETAGGVFTIPNAKTTIPGGSLTTYTTLTTFSTSKITIIPTGPIPTVPTIPGGPGGSTDSGIKTSSKPFTFVLPPSQTINPGIPPVQTYPPSPPPPPTGPGGYSPPPVYIPPTPPSYDSDPDDGYY